MERMKLVSLLLAVLLCVSAAQAADYYRWWGVTTNNDWNTPADWTIPAWNAATVAPTNLDTVNLCYSGGFVGAGNGDEGGYTTITAGYTATALRIGMGGPGYYGEATYGDRLDISGTLSMPASTQSLYFGRINSSAGNTAMLSETKLNILPGANVNIYSLRINNTNTTTSYRITQTGGTVYFDQISLNSTGSLSTVYFDLSGGALTIADNAYGPGPSTSRQMLFDIKGTGGNSGTLTLENSQYANLFGKGFLKANGVIITTENKASLITETAVNVVNAAGSTVACTQITLIPEPATLALLGLGAIAAFRRRR